MALRALQGPTGGGAPVGGTGTTNTIPRWTGPSALGDSVITQSGSVGLEAITISRASATNNALLVLSTPSGTAQQLFMRGGTAVEYFDFFRSNATGAMHVQGSQAGFNNICLAPTSGNVGIGTASPVSHGAGAVTLAVNGTSLSMMDWMVNGTRTMAGFAQAVISQFGTVTSSPLAFLTANTERARIDSAGNLILNTANTGATIQAAGSQQGLKLPATPGNADTQTLDCYQELTWTPELRFGGAATGITYTVRQGYYTRVGNLVTVQCYFVLSSKGTATGVATIEGLPATVSASTGAFSGAAIGWIQNITYTSFPAFHANVGTTSIILWNPASGGAGAQLTDAQFAATSGVIFTMTYRV